MAHTLPSIAILGAGSMGGAIATGLSRSGLAPRVTVTNRTAAKASSLACLDGVTTVALADAVRRALDAGVVVVVSTRIASGPVDAAYGGGGGAADLVATGALLSRRLRPGQARIVLLALLAAGVGPRWIGAYLGR